MNNPFHHKNGKVHCRICDKWILPRSLAPHEDSKKHKKGAEDWTQYSE